MGMFPLAFAMLPEVFPAARVGQAQGIVSGMFAAGASLGLVGGGYIAYQFGWQLTYHTVTPVAILLVVLAYVYLRESPHLSPKPIDLPGIGSLGFALAMVMFGLTEGVYWGWTSFSAVTFGRDSVGGPRVLPPRARRCRVLPLLGAAGPDAGRLVPGRSRNGTSGSRT